MNDLQIKIKCNWDRYWLDLIKRIVRKMMNLKSFNWNRTTFSRKTMGGGIISPSTEEYPFLRNRRRGEQEEEG